MPILFAISLSWKCQVLAASLPLAPPALPVGWQRVEIQEVGTIDIPPSMEVQSAKYAQLKNKYAQLKNLPFADSATTMSGRIVIQQKGLNEFIPMAASSYVRIIVETDVGKSGDFESLNSRFEATSDELHEISTLLRPQVKAEVENRFAKILQWDVPSLAFINGMQAIRLSYRRQYQDNPPVRVKTYIFQNDDRRHFLDMSYREAERSKWLPDFPAILSSFRITNVRGQETSGGPSLDPEVLKWIEQQPEITNVQSEETSGKVVPLLHRENWGLILIFSAILTWGIGLGPPLLVRFAFMRKPMSEKGAGTFVVVFFFVNLAMFTALGSESKTHSAFFFVAMASYYIPRRGAKKGKLGDVQSPPPRHGKTNRTSDGADSIGTVGLDCDTVGVTPESMFKHSELIATTALASLEERLPAFQRMIARDGLDNWSFCFATAFAHTAIREQPDDLSDQEFDDFRSAVRRFIPQWQPDGVDAFNNLNSFMEMGQDVPDHAALGMWVLWNLAGKRPTQHDEIQLAGVLGSFITAHVTDWWNSALADHRLTCV